ncbi:MAG: hypothetical protein RLZZ210_335 [Pseudomonadota bacterium]|jgi:sec-independent protein translocase protein TatA
MGAGSLWHWIVVAIVVALIFGTKKLRNVGEDLGAAIKGFKEGMKQEQEATKLENNPENKDNNATK